MKFNKFNKTISKMFEKRKENITVYYLRIYTNLVTAYSSFNDNRISKSIRYLKIAKNNIDEESIKSERLYSKDLKKNIDDAINICKDKKKDYRTKSKIQAAMSICLIRILNT